MTEQTDLSTQLTRVEEKLVELKNLDRSFSIFGASVHRYRLNVHLSDSEIGNFEDAHNIELPPDYKILFALWEMVEPDRFTVLED